MDPLATLAEEEPVKYTDPNKRPEIEVGTKVALKDNIEGTTKLNLTVFCIYWTGKSALKGYWMLDAQINGNWEHRIFAPAHDFIIL